MQPTENATIQVRLSGEEFHSFENWRRAQEKIPPRSEAIREAIRRLVHPADNLPRSDNRRTALVRERLPNRRATETFNFEVEGIRYCASVSRFVDGRIGEIFLGNGKVGSQSDTSIRDAASAVSLALQHGCTLDVLRDALLRDAQGKAATPLGMALDLVAEREGSQANAEKAR
jgi:hypothetical protein